MLRSIRTQFRWIVFILGFVFIVSACSPSSQSAATLTSPPTDAPTATAEPAVTSLPEIALYSDLPEGAIGDPAQGQEIYKDMNYVRCEFCHSLDGSEFRGGPTLLGISERAGKRVPELSAVEYLRQSILEPSAVIVEGFEDKMKVYALVERPEGEYKAPLTLTEEELNNLIAFLLTQ